MDIVGGPGTNNADDIRKITNGYKFNNEELQSSRIGKPTLVNTRIWENIRDTSTDNHNVMKLVNSQEHTHLIVTNANRVYLLSITTASDPNDQTYPRDNTINDATYELKSRG